MSCVASGLKVSTVTVDGHMSNRGTGEVIWVDASEGGLSPLGPRGGVRDACLLS